MKPLHQPCEANHRGKLVDDLALVRIFEAERYLVTTGCRLIEYIRRVVYTLPLTRRWHAVAPPHSAGGWALTRQVSHEGTQIRSDRTRLSPARPRKRESGKTRGGENIERRPKQSQESWSNNIIDVDMELLVD